MVLVKNGQFFYLFILGKIGQQNVFYDILERKIALLDYKNKKFNSLKSLKIGIFYSPWFWSKIGNFSIFLFLAK